jgi:hypothetical protein
MKKFFSAILAGAALVAFVNSASADTNLIGSDDYSFEDPVITSSTPYIITTSIPDWTFSPAGGGEATGVQTISSAFDNTGTSDGLNYALLNIQQNGPGIITYTGAGAAALPDIAPDTSYTLTVAVGNRTQDYSSAVGGTDTVDLLAGSDTFGTTVNEADPLLTPDTFTDESVTLSAATIQALGLVGQPLGIQLVGSQYGSDSFDQAAFDNVRLTAAAVTGPVIVTLYYDTNGSTPGTSTSSTTSDFKSAVWTEDASGSSMTVGYIPASDVVFSAGTNGTGTQAVTVTDAELVDAFTFKNGTVTLNGSGSPNLTIGAGGITVNSNDGPTTLDTSLGTVALGAGQSWNNDSTQALNVNNGVSGSGQTLTFAGVGTGPVNLNGILSGNLNLTATSPTSTVNVDNIGPNPPGPPGTYVGTLNASQNSFTGNITVDGGVMNFADIGSLGNGGNNINLSNGGTVSFDATQGFADYSNNINLTGVGQVSAGVYGAGGIDILYSGIISGGPTSVLNVVEGDFIPTSNDAANDVGTVNVTGPTRLLAYGTGLFNDNSTFNVSSTLDMGVGGTFNNTINLANGSALENRSGGVALTNVFFPTGGNATVTLGADDVGTGSLTIGGVPGSPAINLSSGTTLTLDINENHVSSPGNADTSVSLDEAITGSGALTLTLIPGVYNEGTVYLNGNNTYNGPTTINGVTVVTPNNTVSGYTAFGTSAVTLNSATVVLTGGTLANSFTANTGVSYFDISSGTQTLSGPINILSTGPQGTDGLIFSQSGSGALTTTGKIEAAGGVLLDFANSGSANMNVGSIDLQPFNGDEVIFFDSTGAGNITLDGTYTSDITAPPQGSIGSSTMMLGYLSRNGAGNYYIAPSANMSEFEPYDVHGKAAIWMFAGNLYLDNSSFVQGQYIAVDGGGNDSVNVVGAQTINASIYVANLNQLTVSQTTADETNWAGAIQDNNTNLVFSTVDGSRLNIAYVEGGTNYTIVKTGGGTVNLYSANGNDLSGNPGVVADIQQGTLLINNTPGVGFGLGRSGGTVRIEAGATLGGSGSLDSAQQVVAEDATSVIAPGDPGQSGLHFNINPSIGTLSIGSLAAANGLTMDFKLTGGLNGQQSTPAPGIDNDAINVTNLTLNGPVTVNFTVLGSIALDTPYTLIFGSGSGTWTTDPTGAPLTFDFIAPAGYTMADYGSGGQGYIFSRTPSNSSLTVEFIPEPSTYGLLGLGLLALVAIGRFRRLDD